MKTAEATRKRIEIAEGLIKSQPVPVKQLSEAEMASCIATIRMYRRQYPSKADIEAQARARQHAVSLQGSEAVQIEEKTWQKVRDNNYTKSYWQCLREITGINDPHEFFNRR